ncbi:class I SAM-dependent methyltransferase [Enterococcus crotali]|uniref:class I SAM-dependent methyltransferase n=1 Tax=Enterococcus crotali TaxID=1453587 RepID=UPI0004702C0A|nr:class I SAM-dependent methyltransferase [Enterococcus crotali]
MAFIKLHSTNPKLSYLLYKNPASGMQLRKIRKGFGYGWYPDEFTYCAYFSDSDSTISFRPTREEENHYLNVSQYQAPLAYLALLTEYFSYPMKEQEFDEKGNTHTLVFASIAVRRKHFLRFFQQQFPSISLTYEEQLENVGTLTIQTEESLHDLLHYTQLFLFFQALFAPEFLDEAESSISKQITSLKAIDAPFYLRNLFVRHFLNRRNLFNRFKEEIEETTRYTIQFAFGQTNLQRRNLAESLLDFDHSIVDIGCGEGYYISHFSQKLNEKSYSAIDIDSDALAVAKEKVAKKELENVDFYSSLEEWVMMSQSNEPIDVLLMEVVEHMEKSVATTFVQQILQQNINKLILSTPNRSFNQHYYLTEGQMRHDDHDWEMNETEFKTWITELVDLTQYTIEFLAIGDQVDQVSTTQGVLIKRKEQS